MKISTVKKWARLALIICFWVAVWWAIAAVVKQELLVPTPLQVLQHLKTLAKTSVFWYCIGHTVLRILAGFAVGVILGSLTGIFTAKISLINQVFAPLITVVKATPVASFIILTLVWLGRDTIPMFIAFLMVFPVVQSNVHTGVQSTPKQLLEMAKLFKVSPFHRFKALYVPAVMPYFSAGCRTAFGLAWKAGVAAEVICLPTFSIGKQLYYSKLYLETSNVFAWTLAVIVLSLLIEKLVTRLLKNVAKGGAVQ